MAQEPFSLPDLKTPPPKKPIKLDTARFADTNQALQGKTAGGWLDQMAADIQRSDPENAPILMGMMEARVRTLTGDSTFQFQSAQDRELANLKFERERLLLQREIAKGQVDEAFAAMVDNPDVAKRFGPVDAIRKNPEMFSAVAQEMGFKVTPGHFAVSDDKYAGLSSDQAIAAQEEEAKATAAKVLSQEQGAVSDLLSLGKNLPALDFKGRAEAGLKERGKQMGDTQLFPPGWQFWTGSNEASWQGANRELESKVAEAGPVLGKRQAQGFLEVLGDELHDVFEDLDREKVKTEGGGEQSVIKLTDDPMVQQAALFLGRAAQAANLPIQDVLKLIKVDANAVDFSGLKQ